MTLLGDQSVSRRLGLLAVNRVRIRLDDLPLGVVEGLVPGVTINGQVLILELLLSLLVVALLELRYLLHTHQELGFRITLVLEAVAESAQVVTGVPVPGAHSLPDPACQNLSASIPFVEGVVHLRHCVRSFPLGLPLVHYSFMLLKELLLVLGGELVLAHVDPVQVLGQHLQQILLTHIVDVLLRDGVHDGHAFLVRLVARVAFHDLVQDVAQLHLVLLKLLVLILDELGVRLGLGQSLHILHIDELRTALLASRKGRDRGLVIQVLVPC